ncbi:hypothetical protein N7530_010633 [Penicillium desertorum]|uniref:Uncharacterized protein n=1 Tax=Penicillium desertorum TaxID=1303715 RepID=A0A9X0BHX5_9EURO|nr:hypothetical protein N7530_010633 [Penicillium desertorum]
MGDRQVSDSKNYGAFYVGIEANIIILVNASLLDGHIGFYQEHSGAMEKIIEEDIGHPAIKAASLPPRYAPVQLTQGAIDKLKAIEGLAVQKIDDDDDE